MFGVKGIQLLEIGKWLKIVYVECECVCCYRSEGGGLKNRFRSSVDDFIFQ